jgi:catechol 2,3-dioxygenase-like lactoylglutathione lyase family enzyme
MNNKLDHITFAVENLEETIKSYGKILPAYALWDQGIVTHRPGVRIAMLSSKNGPRIEFLQPAGGIETRFSDFLKAHGEGVFGMCFFCEEYDGEIERLRENGVAFEEERQEDLFPGYPFRVAWIPPGEAHHGIWLELVDSKALPPFEKE